MRSLIVIFTLLLTACSTDCGGKVKDKSAEASLQCDKNYNCTLSVKACPADKICYETKGGLSNCTSNEDGTFDCKFSGEIKKPDSLE